MYPREALGPCEQEGWALIACWWFPAAKPGLGKCHLVVTSEFRSWCFSGVANYTQETDTVLISSLINTRSPQDL